MNVADAVAWARRRFPFQSATFVPDAPPDHLPSQAIAAVNAARAIQMFEDGDDGEHVVYRLGTGLNGLAADLGADGRAEAAKEVFHVAYSVLTGLHSRADQPEHFRKAISFAFGNLKGLGLDEIGALQTPPTDAEPFLDLDEALMAAHQASLPPETSSIVGPAGVHTAPVRSNAALPSRTKESVLAALSSAWDGPRLDINHAGPSLRTYLADQLGRSGILDRDLGALFDVDVGLAVEFLGDTGLPTDRVQLQNAAREFRTFAFQAGTDEQERRLRWLVAGLTNLHLWRSPAGLPTNEPQLQIDLMGYVGATIMDRRYFDADRDLLLDCAEAHVRIAANITPVVLGRFAYLREWLLASVGTYLLLGGPDPSGPSDSYYDERIHSDDAPAGRGLQRAEREQWPEILLGRWQPDSDKAAGATYALASLAGWELSRAHWLTRLIFSEIGTEGRELEERYWLDRLEGLMGRFARVRVAANPWGHDGASGVRGSMITSDPSGRLVIPDAVLRAAASQGLTADDAVTVHGQLFEGRRVPTYLLTNRFGPFAILKIDHRAKVIREVDTFHAYARRLHQSNRPSECYSHPMDMYLGENGAPLRAIQTSYVFDEDDEPLTMAAWMRRADSADAVAVVKRLLLTSLRPWLAHVRRDRIDLRDEYPMFRSAPAPGKQSPAGWCRTELHRLVTGVAGDPLSVDLADMTRGVRGWEAALGDLPRVLEPAGMSISDAVNPVWLAAEIGEVGTGELCWLVDSLTVGLRDFDTLLALTHGDLHLENILCTSVSSGRPKTVLIDFESAHYGHVCKDLARLEASMLCQVFRWSPDERAAVAKGFAANLSRDGWRTGNAAPVTGSEHVQLVADVVVVLREIARGCGQGHWPIAWEEYHFALLGALLPMARYATLSRENREFALCLAAVIASRLLEAWTAGAAGT